jgi:hypothetical protein
MYLMTDKDQTLGALLRNWPRPTTLFMSTHVETACSP